MKQYSVSMIVGLLAMGSLFSSCQVSQKHEEPNVELKAKPGQELQTPTQNDDAGWKVIEGGLKYRIEKAGVADAQAAKSGDIVAVHYTGWLDKGNHELGQKFDSSVDRGEPFTFNLGAGQVISGWDKGVEGMLIGEKRRLVIPHDYAYGKRGIPGAIPPSATLIFDVELLDVE
ncbi:MAG: Peptidyl-prolyl cis-trans isomerase [candidate division TM6 bacterium GW2011_GWF2_38_10]|nr:MAG: Peptidyl-prolyl cis-trans isomerase [candidate division TM6 bacterium GW2011_GWF2_38_10]